MPFAVIKTGGKQYLVQPGQKLTIEKLPNKEGEEVVFDSVLLSEKDGAVKIGEPFLKDSMVKAKVLSQTKGEKLVVFQFKNKKRYKKKKGHRQELTQIEIVQV
ncbi:MAG: 50S ribosomal protein L21 [Candidatus Wildermuthbacteria bacterium]|nr:50S ribosomal protein L21 [Candidatus Wildermuthbacteria bacterium]